MPEFAIKVENAGKKFTKSLNRSMLYGAVDIMQSALGVLPNSEILRIIGPNGSGKTTLLKMLNGIFMPDRGNIEINGKVGALIQVGAGFHPMLTGKENIFINGSILGMSTKEIKSKFDSIVGFADIGDFLDAPVKHYSSGMYVRLGFAIAIHCNPKILLIDEILAVGDAGFQNKCLNEIGRIRKEGTTTILVSHNMHLISTYTEKCVLMNKGTAQYFENISKGVQLYSKLFQNDLKMHIDKNCNGNDNIHFHDIKLSNQFLDPGDDFVVELPFDSSIDYYDVDIDLTINTAEDAVKYFQATNKAYSKIIDLKIGSHKLTCTYKNIQLNNVIARAGITIWSNKRHEMLFWWSIPLEIKAAKHCTGRNFLQILYELD